MSTIKFVAAFGFVILFASPAAAQSQAPRIVIEHTAAPRQEGLVRVQTSINFYLPGPTGDGDEAQKLRDRARRIVYDMAVRECDVAREVMAKECRLESVNSNINANRQYGSQPQEGYNVTGSMTMQVTLK